MVIFMRANTDKRTNISLIRRRRVFAALALPLALAACGEKKTAQEPVRPVKAFVIQAPASERTLAFSGVVAPRIESQLGFRVSGKIVERFVNAGDRVSAGQALARLDEKDLKLAENSARSAAAAAKTRLAVAKDALDRAAYLFPKGFIAKAAFDQRQLEFDAAKSAADSAEDQLNQAVNATSYALLSADKDGVVTQVRAEPGQVVGAGQAVVMLAHANEIEVSVAVPENEIARLKTGDPARVALWAAPDVASAGKIREIAGAADPASRTYSVRVTVSAPLPEMRLGMTASVSFKLPEAAPPVIAPLTAFMEEGGKTVVYVADADRQTVARREAVLDGVTAEGVRVRSGLKPGDIVVTGGVRFLKDGMKVRLAKEFVTEVADGAAGRPRAALKQ
jgi:membrane fusion protein, multidrug efflux system